MLASALLATGCTSGEGDGPDPVRAVRGSACGYIVNVSLFGGPQTLRGCDQPAGAPATAGSPSVSLPAKGSTTPVTAEDPDGGAAQYGPAVIMGGKWPENAEVPPPTGPITVTTQGTPDGTVTSSARIGLHPTPVAVTCSTGYAPPCTSPGGFGPFPVEGDELNVTCTASATGVTGSAAFKNATHAISTDSDGVPKEKEQVPDSPPPNYTRSGVITNVGDVFTAVYNEQFVNADGSLTVNGVHIYLFGPTAVGDVIKGQATCGRIPSSQSKDTLAPTCSTLVVAPVGPEDPTPKTPRTELVGVFDAGGLQAIENVKSTNGTVQIGNREGPPHLQLVPGQTGPLPITATRSVEGEAGNLPLEWSFDAVDKAGNRVTCPTTRAPTTTAPGNEPPGSTTIRRR